ncbi:MAG TPA: divergent PAP2 family protein [Candidatus Fournierella excrementigallinarum]|nr:divergent PAP2 family protein [Candidatus Fournierella excrementigallinarum]
MELFRQVYGFNYLLSISLTGWLVAQVLKTLINGLLLGKFSLERMWGSGGMPSSHSATVCSLVVAAARLYGPDSAIFGLAFIMAIIVMYDAMGVRRETGEQAKILNRMLTDWMEAESANSPFLSDKKLKEMVGHTPFEVLGGAVVGVGVGWLIPII